MKMGTGKFSPAETLPSGLSAHANLKGNCKHAHSISMQLSSPYVEITECSYTI